MDTTSYIRIERADSLEPGQMIGVSIEGRELAVGKTKDGLLFAVDNVCTHAYARLCEGRLRGNRLMCPLHGASFDVRNGFVLGAPAVLPLTAHTIRALEGRVEVALNRSGEASQS